ncbi:MAG: cysteine--tRNA ligase [Candidatus Omnitrophica bacterium]|nr:cysteine--tRNA ligase [Candidatus Omnitrophota bacterium]MBI3021240.1 cysteine--tRNA ligase [Candidatus Omnitrophota bacterium]
MRLYNTFTRTLQDFEPLQPPTVTMYVCGPTVYDDPHIGHVRSAFTFDLLRRYLEHRGFRVRFVRNVTDVDDKIIEKARQELASNKQQAASSTLTEACRAVAERCLKGYHTSMDRLGIERPDIEPLATEHVIPEMTDFIAKLLLQGVAYETKTGDVYFSVRKCSGYGKLSNRTLDELKAGARIEPGEEKQDPLDFALWKAAKPGEPSWESPWGKGRPGWHIECSAMSTTCLGDAFDIHGGGLDLMFPHHENEIAQAQAAGKPFARFWVHNGLLTVNGEKMSKSLKNYVTIDQALQECWGHDQNIKAEVLKVFFLGAHYRSPIDYTAANIKASGRRYRHLFHCSLFAKEGEFLAHKTPAMPPELRTLKDAFEESLSDDLNTPRAFAALDGIANVIDRAKINLATSDEHQTKERETQSNTIAWAGELLDSLSRILGLSAFEQYQFELTPEQAILLEKREEARRKKDFKTADEIRKRFLSIGLDIEDTKSKPVVRRKG